jgi:hypothetical protein
MSRLNDLAALDLRSLCGALNAGVAVQPVEWLGVVELLTMRLTEGSGDVAVEDWGTCSAAMAYVLGAAVASGGFDRRESVIRRLNLSVALLQNVAPNAEVDILNPDLVLELMFQELPLSAGEARRLSADWRSLDISQIRRLRVAKNLVSPALALARVAPGAKLAGRLRAWEDVMPSLP